MATVYPAARNLCAAATSRWCSEYLHAYKNNSNTPWNILELMDVGGMWGECVMRGPANSGLAASTARRLRQN